MIKQKATFASHLLTNAPRRLMVPVEWSNHATSGRRETNEGESTEPTPKAP